VEHLGGTRCMAARRATLLPDRVRRRRRTQVPVAGLLAIDPTKRHSFGECCGASDCAAVLSRLRRDAPGIRECICATSRFGDRGWLALAVVRPRFAGDAWTRRRPQHEGPLVGGPELGRLARVDRNSARRPRQLQAAVHTCRRRFWRSGCVPFHRRRSRRRLLAAAVADRAPSRRTRCPGSRRRRLRSPADERRPFFL
jgi:hypothetical protein